MDLENGHSPAGNGAAVNGTAKQPQQNYSIPTPESVEQAQLLFLVSTRRGGRGAKHRVHDLIDEILGDE